MEAQKGTLLITAQMADLLERLPVYVYTRPVSLFHGSTVGEHFRHILEFYTCLLKGCDAVCIDYSGRERNEIISENPETALSILHSIEAAVSGLRDVEKTVLVKSAFSDTVSSNSDYPSSIGRELQYAFDHAVHHLAIIRMGLEIHFPEIPVDADLGVAPSTLKHRKEHTIPTTG